MEVGAVDFKDQKLKKFKHEVMKEKAILKAILKTKREEYPDLEKLQEEKLQDEKRARVDEFKKQQKELKEESIKKKAEAELKSYKTFMQKDKMTSNKHNVDDDDFM